MNRIDFIKRSTLAGISLGFINKVVAKDVTCIPTPEETEGPFPTHKPAGLVSQNIVAGKKGVPLIINIAVLNINDQCVGLKDAIVDIWHCDNNGEYSEYGGKDEHGFMAAPGDMKMMPPPPPMHDSLRKGTDAHMPPPMHGGSMQTADHVKEHFLRGRQQTNKNGDVVFHSVYPGWYISRAPHIHVHIYNSAGESLLVTQIALPGQTCNVVYAQGVYAAHGFPETTNANDNVFGDSIANEMATITGNLKDGYTLHHSIYVKA